MEGASSYPIRTRFALGIFAYQNSASNWQTIASSLANDTWHCFQIEWRSSDKKARFRVNEGNWTDWLAQYSNFVNYLEKVRPALNAGAGTAYFDYIAENPYSADTNINVSDQLNITESVSVEVEAPPVEDLDINVSDQLNLTEDTEFFVTERYINVSDQLNISEDTTTAPDPTINISDQLNITESVTLPTKPTAETQAATNITTTAARINGKIANDGGEACDARFRWRSKEGIIIDSYGDEYYSAGAAVNGNEYWGHGQSFTGTGRVIDRIVLSFKKIGTPTGNAYVKIYAHSGTFGESSVPTGEPLAISEAIDVSTFTTSYVATTIYFTGANRITLTNDTKYFLSVEFTGGDDNNRIVFTNDKTYLLHGGNNAWTETVGEEVVWVAYPEWDCIFYLYGESDWTTTDWDTTGYNTNDEYFHDLSGLDAGTTYEFQTQAKNGTWEGDWTASREFTTLGASDISVYDYLEITEDISVAPDPAINVSDQLNLTEDTSLLITELHISVSDQLNITEDTSLVLTELYISVSDQVNLTEDTGILIPELYASVSEQLNITEDIALLIAVDGEINVLDTINITENIAVAPDPTINISEQVNITEDISINVEAPADQDISVFDQLNITEDVSAVLSDPNISVSDQLDITEDIDIARIVDLNINVAEELTISEATELLIPELFLTTQDNIQLTEYFLIKGIWGWKDKSTAVWTEKTKHAASWTEKPKSSATWDWETLNI